MFGTLFGGRGERPVAAEPYALPPANRQKNGMYRLRALGDERVRTLLEAARAGDWTAVKAALAPFDLGHDDRVLGELAEVDGVQDWIRRAVAKDGKHRATALLISGARHVVWGWKARTAAPAAHVTPKQWRVFHRRLEVAEKQLFRAAELRPDWVTPWCQLLTSGRGMSLGPVAAETRFDAAVRRDPLDAKAHTERVMQLQPRWGGEPGQALAFARDAVARAPQGHRLGCLIARAHIEDWFEAEAGDGLETRAIRAELREAAERSVLHPDYVRRPGWQYDFSEFAMALSLAGERRTIRRVFRQLDGAYTGRPWTLLAQPERRFARHLRGV